MRRSLEVSATTVTAAAMMAGLSGCDVIPSVADRRCAMPTVATADVDRAAHDISVALNHCAPLLPESRRVPESRLVSAGSNFALGFKIPIGQRGTMVIKETATARLPSGLPDPNHLTSISATEFTGRKMTKRYAWLVLEREPPKGTTWGITWVQKDLLPAHKGTMDSVAQLSGGELTSEGNTESVTPDRNSALTALAVGQIMRWMGARPGNEPLPLQVPAPMLDDADALIKQR